MRCLFIIFIFFYSFVFPQSRIDTLRTELNENEESSVQRIDLLNQLGYEYWIVNANKSIIHGLEALTLANELNYEEGLAMANRVIGVAYWAQGVLDKALKYLTEAEMLYMGQKDEVGLANTIMNIGMVYADLELYNKAEENYVKAIDKFTALNLKGRIATTYTKLGTLYLNNNELQQATAYLNNALKMHTEGSFTYGIAEAHNRLGLLFIEKKEFEQAYYHLQRSISLGKEINDMDGLINNLTQYGRLLRLDNQLDASDVQLQLAKQSAKENKLKKYELQIYDELKELRKQQGKPEEALVFYDKYLKLSDSILSSEKSMLVTATEFKSQLNEKNKELAYLTQKEKKDALVRWILIGGLSIIAILSFLLIRNFKEQAKRSKALLGKNRELLASKEELANTALENAHLKQQELKQQLNFKNKELTSYALNFVQKNELLLMLQEKIRAAKGDALKDQSKLINGIGRILKQHLTIDKDWEDFRLHFEQVHTGFFTKLKEKHPDLSANDLKICTLTRINLNIKETAGILGISPESVKTARYRLRKKMDLKPDQELLDYFLSLEKM